MTEPKVICGAGCVVQALEHALSEAKEGRLDAVIIVGLSGNGCGWSGAFKDDIAFPWPRLQAAVDTAQMELLRDGVAQWS